MPWSILLGKLTSPAPFRPLRRWRSVLSKHSKPKCLVAKDEDLLPRAVDFSACHDVISPPVTRLMIDETRQPARFPEKLRFGVQRVLTLLVELILQLKAGLVSFNGSHGLHQGINPGVHAVFSQFMRGGDRKSTRLNSSHVKISYAGFCS